MDLQTAARNYLDVKFHHQGRQPWALDCVGLVILAMRDIGYNPVDSSGYSRMPDGIMLQTAMNTQLTQVSRRPEPNDILLMRIRRSPQHIAIATDQGIIHSYESVGKVVEHDLDARWRKRIVAVYTL
jgi:hypothetical protein